MIQKFRAYKLSIELYKQCKKMKLSHHMKDNLLRASSSVSYNLSEGWGRSYPKEKRKFYDYAMGSIREVQATLELEDINGVKPLADSIGAHIYRLLEQFK